MFLRYVAIPTVGSNWGQCHLFRCCESCKFLLLQQLYDMEGERNASKVCGDSDRWIELGTMSFVLLLRIMQIPIIATTL
jgi:hypothetical protein